MSMPDKKFAPLELIGPFGISAVATSFDKKPPKVGKVPDKTIDESALAARKREIDRARGAGKAGAMFSRLGGSGSTGGMTVARTTLAGGSTLG